MAEFQQTAKVLYASPEDKVILWHLFFFFFLLNSTLSVVLLLTIKFHLKNPCQIFHSVSSCVWGILLSSQWREKSIAECTDRIRFTDYYWYNLDFTLAPEFLENSICFFVVLWKFDSDSNHDLVHPSSLAVYSQLVSDFEKALLKFYAKTQKSNLSSIAPQVGPFSKVGFPSNPPGIPKDSPHVLVAVWLLLFAPRQHNPMVTTLQ